ncbi:hypothetical protein EDB84DRAFT_1530989, partial [Lactarius hengduanensis]
VCTRVDNTAKSSERDGVQLVGEVVNTARQLEVTNAQAIFHKDVEDTYSHIVKRVEIDKQEVESVTGGEEQISATDITTSSNVPEGPPPEHLVLEA